MTIIKFLFLCTALQFWLAIETTLSSRLGEDGMAVAEHLEILSEGVNAWNDWRGMNGGVQPDLTGVDLRNLDLQEINLSKALLAGSNLAHCDLRNANLASAQLECACLAFADLEDAMLAFSNLKSTDLRASNLRNASLEDADLKHADLTNACLEGASLAYADLAHANLMDSDLMGANFKAANMECTNVSMVKYDRKIFRNTIKTSGGNLRSLWQKKDDFILDTTIRCKGVNAATCFGSQRFKLFLQDQDYLEEFLDTHWGKHVCFFWWLTADCGRSVSRWAGWSVGIAFVYAAAYFFLGSEHFASTYLKFNVWNMIYYSVVTFTTLGFGDITPRTTGAAMLVMTEVIIGYIMLGGLITIFASKLSRRSG